MENVPVEPDPMTARQRRARNAKAQARKRLPKTLLRKSLVPAIVVLAVVAIAVGYRIASVDEDCPGHWHGAFATYVNGTRLDYADQNLHAVAYGAAGHDHHIHANDGNYHFHPPVDRCIPTKDMLRRLDVGVSGASLVVGPTHGDLAGTYAPSGAATLQIWHQPPGGEWKLVTWSKVKERQLGDGDRILLTYGTHDPAQLQAEKDSLKDLGTYDPGDV